MALNKVLEEIKEEFANIHRVVKDDVDLEWNRAVYKCEEIVNEVAKKYASGWIPCSERLPEKPKYGEEDSYLVQQSNIEIPFSAYWNGECWTNDLSIVLDKIIAWQPLPEPYRPE